MIKKSALSTAIAASLISVDNLPTEECPLPNFDELAASLHDSICKISQQSFERDAALLAQHQALVKTVAAIDPDSAAQTIADIKAFISAIDADGNGAIDGLAAIIDAVNNLTPRVAELERRANLVDQGLINLGKQAQSNTEATEGLRKDVELLKSRKDEVGVDEARAYEIAAEVTCKTVLKPLQEAFAVLNGKIQAIDCGTENHSAFMNAVNADTGLEPDPNGSAGSYDESGNTSGAAASF